MKRVTIERRLKGSFALLIVFLFAAVALAWLADSARIKAAERQRDLVETRDHVIADLYEMDRAVLARLTDPNNGEQDRSYNEARGELTANVGVMEKGIQDSAELYRALEMLQNFATGDLNKFKSDVFDKAKSDPGGVAEFYHITWPAVRTEQAGLVAKLNSAVQKYISEEDRRAGTISSVCYLFVVLILAASLILAVLLTSSVMQPLMRIGYVVERLGQGDYTERAVNGVDQFGELGMGIHRVAEDVTGLVGQVHRSGIQVNATVTEIAATARQQQSTASEIAATTAEIGATSREISATSKELEKTMNEVSRGSQEAAQLADSGQASLTRMETTMRLIMDASGAIAAKLAVLSEKTANVNTVVTTIAKVADQTNLLSLNAAIEAEKAGEYGLGFAVVAAEIRRLADQTAVATYDIEKMVKEMQAAVATGVMGMEKFSDEVRRGVEEVRQVGTQLARIIHQVQALMPRFQTVHEGMHAQATGAQQISETLAQLSEAAHQTADSLRNSNQAIDHLNEAGRGLQASVSKFRISA